LNLENWVDTDLAKNIWSNKYQYNGETFDAWLDRVSNGNNKVGQLILDKKFLFGGRILANRGLDKLGKKVTYSNCYVIPAPEDNIESIFDTAKSLARTFSYSGGCGVDISKLRPKGMKVHNAAESTTGSTSFMDLYSKVTEIIGAKGRRGALMISILCTHPDVIDFIDIKNDLDKVTKANISIRILNDFMKAVENDSDWTLYFKSEDTNDEFKNVVKAREVFDKLCYNNWNMAEPGMLFWDRITDWCLVSEDEEFEFAGTNPCIPLGEHVLTKSGYKKIEDVKNEIILEGKTYRASDMFKTGEKEVFEVELENGTIVRMTDNHKILTPNGDKELKDLSIGDKVNMDYTPIHDFAIDNESDYEKGIIAGWLVADGSFVPHHDSHSISFSVGDKEFEYAETLESLVRKHIDENFKLTPHSQKTKTCLEGRIHKIEKVSDFNKFLGIENFDKTTIDLLNKSKDFKLGFVRAMFTCDGSSRTSSFAMLCAVNKNILEQIQRLLIEFGIYSNLTIHNHAKSYVAKDGLLRNNATAFKIEIYDEVFKNIGYLTNYKNKSFLEKLKETPKRIQTRKKEQKIKTIESIGIKDVYDINVDVIHHFNLNGIIVHNCAEEPLPAGGSCLLGSINLSEYVVNPFTKDSYFNFTAFDEDVKTSIEGLNEVLLQGLPLHPLEIQRKTVDEWRQIGLGIMGMSDALLKLGIKYGEEDSIRICEDICIQMANSALRTSALIAKEQGVYPKYKKEAILKSPYFNHVADLETKVLVEAYGLAHSQLLTIAPTGTLSTMLGISGGLEPIYNISYNRKTLSLHDEEVIYKVYTPIVEEFMKANGIESEEDLPDYFVTAMTLDHKNRINMQSIWQEYIDASISSTVNVPNEFTVEDVKELYMYAWKKGLKGVTIFRDGCARGGILTNIAPTESEEVKTELPRGMILEVDDTLIGRKRKIVSGCGSLHIEGFFSPENGDLMEVYLSKGSTGGCNAFMVGLSRMISLALRGGIHIESIVDQLNSVIACPSYAVRQATKRDVSVGKCCPDAIGRALLSMQKEMWIELREDEGETAVKQSTQAKEIKAQKSLFSKEELKYKEENGDIDFAKHFNKCPICGAKLRQEGGCMTCSDCGFSRCD